MMKNENFLLELLKLGKAKFENDSLLFLTPVILYFLREVFYFWANF
jgi:hypothetical protein